MELNKKYDSISRREVQIFAESKTDLSFELKNKEALKNISFYNYDASLLNNPKVKVKVKLIEKKLETQKDYSVTLANNEMIAVACELFKKGYPSAENTCFGGNLICYQRTN